MIQSRYPWEGTAMLKRKIEQRLIEWKNTANHKPLIIKGCRHFQKGIF
jgi:hypothetical protein